MKLKGKDLSLILLVNEFEDKESGLYSIWEVRDKFSLPEFHYLLSLFLKDLHPVKKNLIITGLSQEINLLRTSYQRVETYWLYENYSLEDYISLYQMSENLRLDYFIRQRDLYSPTEFLSFTFSNLRIT